MKKIFMSIVAMLMISVACFANETVAECHVTREVNELTAVNQMRISCIDEPSTYLTFFIGEDKIYFNVYEQKEINGKMYLCGKGSNGSNQISAICIADDTIYIPLTGNRQLVVKSKDIVAKVQRIIEQ